MEGNILSPSLLSRNKSGKTLKGVRISTQLELSKIEYPLILCSVTVCLKSGQQLRKNSQHGIKEKKGGNYAGVLMSFFFYASLRRGWHIQRVLSSVSLSCLRFRVCLLRFDRGQKMFF